MDFAIACSQYCNTQVLANYFFGRAAALLGITTVQACKDHTLEVSDLTCDGHGGKQILDRKKPDFKLFPLLW